MSGAVVIGGKIERRDLYRGALVTWHHTPRGGYGFIMPVDAEVVKINPKKIRIRVRANSGSLVERNVDLESLRWRMDAIERQPDPNRETT